MKFSGFAPDLFSGVACRKGDFFLRQNIPVSNFNFPLVVVCFSYLLLKFRVNIMMSDL